MYFKILHWYTENVKALNEMVNVICLIEAIVAVEFSSIAK